jgi:hypothetical protein
MPKTSHGPQKKGKGDNVNPHHYRKKAAQNLRLAHSGNRQHKTSVYIGYTV